jgi:AcrR family transcriptional regulator
MSDAVQEAPPVDETPVARRRAALRQRLLDAAGRVIREQGLSSLRARDLARDAGCALGAIYGVFADLDELVLAVNEGTLDRLEAALTRAVPARGREEGATDAARQIDAMAHAYLAFARSEPLAWRALFDHRMAGGRPVPPAYGAHLRRLFAHLDEPLRMLRPGLDDASRAALARTLFCALHGVVSLGLDEKLSGIGPGDVKTDTGELVRLILAGLRAGQA